MQNFNHNQPTRGTDKRKRESDEEVLHKAKKQRAIQIPQWNFSYERGVVCPLTFGYGFDNFAKVSKGFYIDRTAFIPLIESEGGIIVFFRPRRFGKSLFLSTLAYYYDIRYAKNFDSLFGHLAVATHTPNDPSLTHNTWLVLQWNFSVIQIGGGVAEFENSLNDHLNDSMKAFKDNYQHLLDHEIRINDKNAISSFESLSNAIAYSSYEGKLYILIDEYDTSVNDAVSNNNQQLIEHLKRNTGILPSFHLLFRTIKSKIALGTVGRVFITGIYLFVVHACSYKIRCCSTCS